MSLHVLDRAPAEGRRRFTVEAGRAHPFGARTDAGGVNFAVFSEHAEGVELVLFDTHDAAEPFATVTLDPHLHRTFAVWHVYLRGLRAPVFYAWRVSGPPGGGNRFDPDKLLLDPYARGLSRSVWDRGAACRPGDNTATALRSAVIDHDAYDWAGDRPLHHPADELVIYEMHVGGFTRSATSGVRHPGTFAGVVEKIPHLRSLGVNAVELMPVFDFDAGERNFWGYSTAAFFAPHAGYCVTPGNGTHLDEFRDMVKALHAAGIEVILDVVFNHTDEGNQLGPLFSFAGLDNANYYYLDPADPRYYDDYSGCGNTLMANHPIVSKLIVDCLESWVRDMHVDGFRFDEAAVLTRGAGGAVLDEPPVVWQIELSETLADTKIIAEAWDAAGAYEVGRYPGYRWAEWNGKFRDTMRRFVRSDPGLVGEVADRLGGSADLYQQRGHRPVNSVNFITCHDGFTLADLVSYDRKHNEANGEGNRDGNDDNMSWNCGAEGPTGDPAVRALRERQTRNLATLLMLARGVPMMLGGDEFGRTQGGNNNAYCQNNEIGWVDWRAAHDNAGLLRFWQRLIAFRRRHRALRAPEFLTAAEVSWHGTRLGAPDWDDPQARALAYTLSGRDGDPDLHVMLNMFWEPLEFQIPAGRWAQALDTALSPGADLPDAGTEPAVTAPTYTVAPRGIAVLVATHASQENA
ncbi:glycogen debranching protein GlgX [Mangrovihabitans endophyticus]|uniref:Glycogen debranching enzyme n=1 Tax=Mangrovihabitans endophyticus TaxID=1751298 RepID=A0A8J3FPI2_9ACTN|nr:glycogen debranching protein GlgX [Mangrovihabitans endophyticus]GGK99665.1 glycogen debranching enzyme [Mangrovihabitans endophyticus]